MAMRHGRRLSGSHLSLSSGSACFILFGSFGALDPFDANLSRCLCFSLSVGPTDMDGLYFPSVAVGRHFLLKFSTEAVSKAKCPVVVSSVDLLLLSSFRTFLL